MQILETSSCEDLGRTARGTHQITALEHEQRFFAFDTCDVWTADGWLITAVGGNGVTHIRKGQLRGTAVLDADEVLTYTPNPKSRSQA